MKTCLNCGSENPDDARYCARCRFTLDWSTTATGDPEQVLPQASGPPLEVAMGPPEVRVRPGESATFQARVANRGTGQARTTLAVAGGAAPYATVRPDHLDLAAGATGAATVAVAIPAQTAPQTIPVSLHVAQAGAAETSVAAQASLVVEAASAVTPTAGPRRGLLATLAGVAALALAAVAIGVLGLGGDGEGGDEDKGGETTAQPGGGGDGGGVDGGGTDGGGGEVRVMGRVKTPSGVCAHTEPNLDAASKIPPGGARCLGIDNGGEFEVECKEANGVLKLQAPKELVNHWITSSPQLVQLEGDPPPC